MYAIKARNGSVFEPNKAPSVGLTLGLLDKPFGLWNSGCSDNSMKIQAKRNFLTAMVGSEQVLLDSDKTVELGESDCLNVRKSDGNRSRGVRRDRIKQNKPTLRQRSGPDPKGYKGVGRVDGELGKATSQLDQLVYEFIQLVAKFLEVRSGYGLSDVRHRPRPSRPGSGLTGLPSMKVAKIPYDARD
ncbi:hypothetical protein F2Q69_00054932 [Brassica cretica]|uniref:Uncharacterized protein n=1 Tax=Brassica cretica TaxID=69181 RepID=A0A8S9MSR1_BRACR|nr:hypothetical protein F2Q69_00054932 [Brassica cretica]